MVFFILKRVIGSESFLNYIIINPQAIGFSGLLWVYTSVYDSRLCPGLPLGATPPITPTATAAGVSRLPFLSLPYTSSPLPPQSARQCITAQETEGEPGHVIGGGEGRGVGAWSSRGVSMQCTAWGCLAPLVWPVGRSAPAAEKLDSPNLKEQKSTFKNSWFCRTDREDRTHFIWLLEKENDTGSSLKWKCWNSWVIWHWFYPYPLAHFVSHFVLKVTCLLDDASTSVIAEVKWFAFFSLSLHILPASAHITLSPVY